MAEKNDKINSPPPYVIPSDNKELQSFSHQFKFDMMEQVIGIISFAVEHNLPIIEVFQFKNSDFVITLSEKDYLTNLDNIYSYYIEKEAYEYCPRVVKLQKTLKEKSAKNTDENQTHRNQRS
jgi:hypothetical protein